MLPHERKNFPGAYPTLLPIELQTLIETREVPIIPVNRTVSIGASWTVNATTAVSATVSASWIVSSPTPATASISASWNVDAYTLVGTTISASWSIDTPWAWFRSTDGVFSGSNPATNLSFVSFWSDISGNGRNIGASVGSQPLYRTNRVNGKPTVQFTNNTLMTNGSSISTAWTLLVVAVVNTNVGSAANNPVFGSNSAFSNGIPTPSFGRNPTSGLAQIFSSGGSINGGTITIGTYFKAAAIFNAASSKIRLNGVNTISGNVGNYTFFTFRVGSGGAFLGEVAEILVFDRAMTDTEIQAIEGYFLSRYAL